jgi:hypothetical protein
VRQQAASYTAPPGPPASSLSLPGVGSPARELHPRVGYERQPLMANFSREKDLSVACERVGGTIVR